METKGYQGFKFAIPTLPKNVYEFVQGQAKEHGVQYWHVVLMAMKALNEMSPESRTSLIKKVMERYPYPGYKGKNTHDDSAV